MQVVKVEFVFESFMICTFKKPASFGVVHPLHALLCLPVASICGCLVDALSLIHSVCVYARTVESSPHVCHD